MTSEEFHALVEEYTHPSASDDGDTPLTLARLAELEQDKGIKCPAFYKEFLSMYGAGDFGYVTVLSPDVDSKFPIWETVRPKFLIRNFSTLSDNSHERHALWTVAASAVWTRPFQAADCY